MIRISARRCPSTYTSAAKQIVDNISTTIDVIADNFADLQSAKENGRSRTECLKSKLDDMIDKYKEEDTEKFISEIKDSLKNFNTKIGIKVFGKEIDIFQGKRK